MCTICIEDPVCDFYILAYFLLKYHSEIKNKIEKHKNNNIFVKTTIHYSLTMPLPLFFLLFFLSIFPTANSFSFNPTINQLIKFPACIKLRPYFLMVVLHLFRKYLFSSFYLLVVLSYALIIANLSC